jgi:hypothetical protein
VPSAPRNEGERRRASAAFDQEEGKGEGSDASGATQRKEEGEARVWSRRMEEGDGGGGLAGYGADRGARPTGVGGNHPVHVRQGMKGGPVRRPRLGRCHGPAHMHSANFDLKRISKLSMI